MLGRTKKDDRGVTEKKRTGEGQKKRGQGRDREKGCVYRKKWRNDKKNGHAEKKERATKKKMA